MSSRSTGSSHVTETKVVPVSACTPVSVRRYSSALSSVWRAIAVREYLLSNEATTEETPFGPEVLVYKVCGKMFALAAPEDVPARMNLKCDPEQALDLRDQYEGITPGYHMNKKHWNTVLLDGSVPGALAQVVGVFLGRLLVAAELGQHLGQLQPRLGFLALSLGRAKLQVVADGAQSDQRLLLAHPVALVHLDQRVAQAGWCFLCDAHHAAAYTKLLTASITLSNTSRRTRSGSLSENGMRTARPNGLGYGASSRKPAVSSASALPDLLETERLPCLAT